MKNTSTKYFVIRLIDSSQLGKARKLCLIEIVGPDSCQVLAYFIEGI